MNRYCLAAALAALCAAGAALDPASGQEPEFVWAQAHPDRPGADGQLIARALVAADAPCPAARLGDAEAAMQERPNGTDADFAVKVCELVYDGALPARIGAVALAPRPADPRRILVVGDTGCRITEYAAQACNDPSAWPWQRIARLGAAQQPDLIIHIGDYHYREKPCAGRADCAGSPVGDSWPAWRADFFAPAAELLAVAPWVMLRGNHEECARAGTGWQLLLAPVPGTALHPPCVNDTEPYRLALGRLQLAVLDSATAGNTFARVQRTAEYEAMMQKLAPSLAAQPGAAAAETWLLLHHPLWISYGGCATTSPFRCIQRDLLQDAQQVVKAEAAPLPAADLTQLSRELAANLQDPLGALRAWFAERPPGPVSMVLSGHAHAFQLFAPKRRSPAIPLQLVVGTGGDALDRYPALKTQTAPQPAEVYGVAGELWSRQEFGFAMLTRGDGGWTATFHDVAGTAKLACDLAARSCNMP